MSKAYPPQGQGASTSESMKPPSLELKPPPHTHVDPTSSNSTSEMDDLNVPRQLIHITRELLHKRHEAWKADHQKKRQSYPADTDAHPNK
ncbi:hypothetical protein PMIN03_007344 [Paraphaeosphaeria minitans]